MTQLNAFKRALIEARKVKIKVDKEIKEKLAKEAKNTQLNGPVAQSVRTIMQICKLVKQPRLLQCSCICSALYAVETVIGYMRVQVSPRAQNGDE